MITYFGTIIHTQKHGNTIYIICEDNDIYTLLEHNLTYDITDVIKRVSDIDYIEYLLKQKICNDNGND